jgi:hypothetical protein
LQSKVSAFKGFFKLNSPKSKVWIDKVCLDKSANSGLAFAALPLHVGLCDSLLVVLSPTYLKRLWCVWELGTLFFFDVRELVESKIEILVVKEPAAPAKWDIDTAHAFDPNEELRLRKVMLALDPNLRRFKDAAASLTQARRWRAPLEEIAIKEIRQ